MQNIQFDRERFDKCIFEIRCSRCGYQDFGDLIKRLIPLTERLPGKLPEWKHRERLFHCFRFGYILTVSRKRKFVGYAEIYQTSGMPKHPVIPYPISEDSGKFFYVWAAVADGSRMIRRMKEYAAKCFDIEEIGYHRHKRGNAAHVERNKKYGNHRAFALAV